MVVTVLSGWDVVEPERFKKFDVRDVKDAITLCFSTHFSSSGTGIFFNHSVRYARFTSMRWLLVALVSSLPRSLNQGCQVWPNACSFALQG